MELLEGFELLVKMESINVVVFKLSNGKFDVLVYCLQFYLEVIYSLDGVKFLCNFL